MSEIVAVLPERKFSSCLAGEGAMWSALREQHCCAEPLTIDNTRSIVMDAQGRLGGRWQPTNACLQTICEKLSPGLWQVFASLCGKDTDWGIAGVSRREDPALAISVFNSLVRARFELLRQQRLLVDNLNERAVGLSYRNFVGLSNLVVLQQLVTYLKQQSEPYVFAGASLQGFLLDVCYHSEAAKVVLGDDVYHSGYQLCNSEAGEIGFRTAAVLVRGRDLARATRKMFKYERLGRMSADESNKRLGSLFRQITDSFRGLPGLRTHMLQLRGRPLGLGGDEAAHKARRRVIQNRLANCHSTRAVIMRVITHALTFGSGEETLAKDQLPMDVYATRTAYDLFASLLTCAAELPSAQRCGMERLAYRLLSGEVRI